MLPRFLLAALFAFFCVARVGAQEEPPYSPPVDEKLMTTFRAADLGFSVRYPAEFMTRPTADLLAVMRAGHQHLYAQQPDTDPEHRQAEKCLHTLLYATSTPQKSQGGATDDSTTPDTLLVQDVDPACLNGMTGEKALTQLTGSLLNQEGYTQQAPQTWFVAGGERRIHSGVAAIVIPADHGQAAATEQKTSALLAASFMQGSHYILILYFDGTRSDGVHTALSYTSVSFEDKRPILLFPFLFGKLNMIK